MSNPFKHQKPVATPMVVPQPSELRKLVFKQGKVMRATLKNSSKGHPKISTNNSKSYTTKLSKNRLLKLWQLLQNHLTDVVRKRHRTAVATPQDEAG